MRHAANAVAFALAILLTPVLAPAASLMFRVVPFYGNAQGQAADYAILDGDEILWLGGAPFYVQDGHKPILSTAAANPVVLDLNTSPSLKVASTVGVFLCTATPDTVDAPLAVTDDLETVFTETDPDPQTVGTVSYRFDDNTTVEAKLAARPHNTSFPDPTTPNLSPNGSLYVLVDGKLVRYKLTVVFHAFASAKTLNKITITQTGDTSALIYGITAAVAK